MDGPTAKAGDILSFRAPGRWVESHEVEAEYEAIRGHLKSPPTPENLSSISRKSGSHLLKMITPRASGHQAVLRLGKSAGNSVGTYLPSTNAPEIPHAKVIYRPIEVRGHAPRSLVDHVLEPDDLTGVVKNAFAKVFGEDCLTAVEDGLLSPIEEIIELPDGEFPVVFLPYEIGGDMEDIQVTPVSPAAAFTAMGRVMSPYFQKQTSAGPKVPRGSWSRQALSSKPQNISGAIGGPRKRFHATFPTPLLVYEAELYSYAHGGRFPHWRDESIADRVTNYVRFHEKAAELNQVAVTEARDNIAKGLVRGAIRFTQDVLRDTEAAFPDASLPSPPPPGRIIMSRYWPEKQLDQVRRVLSSPEFIKIEREVEAMS